VISHLSLMPEFISKLQYKNYEKGEYSDEKARNLTDTLQLIKSFPWDEQRGVEIQLTCPSVTVRDEYGNYLKVAIYFNGKFCLYYLDTDGHLYEFHTEDLNIVCGLVTDFFNQQLDIQKFEKNYFSIGSRKHFETCSFEYSVNNAKMLLNFFLMSFLSFVAISGVVACFRVKDMPKPFILLFLFLTILSLSTFYFMIRLYFKTRNMHVNISKGTQDFQFGQDGALEDYKKENISFLNIYGQTAKSSRIFNLMELVFKDGTNLIVPGILIDPYDFILKFPGIEANHKGGYFLTSKIFWSYSK
jgi:hypothetical protein